MSEAVNDASATELQAAVDLVDLLRARGRDGFMNFIAGVCRDGYSYTVTVECSTHFTQAGFSDGASVSYDSKYEA